MRRAGVSADRPVVAYDDWAAHAAARCWWLLRHHGHADVRVLDGGWSAWVAGGGEVETGGVDLPEGDFEPGAGRDAGRRTDGCSTWPVLVDARAPERYRGETEPIDPVAGRIPGAVNVPTITNLGADGRFRSPDQLRALYAGGRRSPRRHGGRGLLRLRRHRDPRPDRPGADRCPGGALPGQLVGWITDPPPPVEAG